MDYKEYMFDRPLSSQERRFYFQPQSIMTMSCRLIGTISEEDFLEASRKTVLKHPYIETSMVIDGDTIKFSSKDVSKIDIKIFEREDDKTWKDILDSEFEIPMNLSKGPLIRFILVSGQDKCEIILFVHHSLGDAFSMYYLLKDLLNFINNDKIPVIPIRTLHVMDKSMIPDYVKQKFIDEQLDDIQKLNKEWEQEKVVFDEDDASKIRDVFWNKYKHRSHDILLDRRETDSVINICKEKNVSVSSFLYILFIDSMAKTLETFNGDVSVILSTNVRKKLKYDFSGEVGCYAGGIIFSYKYKELSFWELVEDFNEYLFKKLDEDSVFESTIHIYYTDETLMDALTIYSYADSLNIDKNSSSKIGQFMANKESLPRKLLSNDGSDTEYNDANIIFLANIGNIELPEKIKDAELDRVFLGAGPGTDDGLHIFSCTASGKLSISIVYAEPETDGLERKEIIETAKMIIEKEIDGIDSN